MRNLVKNVTESSKLPRVYSLDMLTVKWITDKKTLLLPVMKMII